MRVAISAKKPADKRVDDSGVALDVQEAPPALKRPRRYLVIMLNDDYTPMDFVVYVLQHIFDMEEQRAVRAMLEVHTKGQAVVGIYSRQIAETQCRQTVALARSCEYPLLCKIEPAQENDDVG